MNDTLFEIFRTNKKETKDYEKLQMVLKHPVSVEQASTECIGQIQQAEHSEEKAQVFLREIVLNESNHLDEYIVGQNVLGDLSNIPISAGALVVSKLQEWSGALSSQLLWIVGPPNYDLSSNMSFAALSIILTATKLNIPLLSHFCALPSYNPDGYPQPREQIALIGLTSSLIRQLIQQMPPEINTGIDLSVSRLQKLNGSNENWDEALELLKDLLHHFPMPILLCVIDGLGRLDYKQGSPFCAQLLEILMDKCSASGTRFKMLLTTSGNPVGDALRKIPEHQRYYETQLPGLNGRGGCPLNVSQQLSG